MASMMELQNAEFKEAFDEFDTVKEAACSELFLLVLLECPFVCFVPQQKSGFIATSKCCLGGAAMFVLVSIGKVFVILFKVV